MSLPINDPKIHSTNKLLCRLLGKGLQTYLKNDIHCRRKKKSIEAMGGAYPGVPVLSWGSAWLPLLCCSHLQRHDCIPLFTHTTAASPCYSSSLRIFHLACCLILHPCTHTFACTYYHRFPSFLDESPCSLLFCPTGPGVLLFSHA